MNALPTDQPTDQPTNRPTDTAYYRDARTHLKNGKNDKKRKWGWNQTCFNTPFHSTSYLTQLAAIPALF